MSQLIDELEDAPVDGVTIKNIGPVETIHLPCPKNGGLVVLRGSNGSGKSEALATVGAVLGDKGAKTDLRPHDGTDAGKAEAWGMTLKVGRSNRQSGELEVFSLSDKLDLSDLVDPGLKGAAENDARRLKALIKVAAAKADINLFAELLDADGLKLVAPDVATNPDLIAMATGIKSMADAEARKAEDARDAALRKLDVAKGAAEGVDTESTPHDEESLKQSYRQAVATESTLATNKAAYDAAVARQSEAQAKLDAARAAYTGPTPERAEAESVAAHESVDRAVTEVERLKTLLEAARENHRRADTNAATVDRIWADAKRHATTLDVWQKTITDAIPACPEESEIANAKAATEAAHAAMSQGQTVRNALAKLEEAQQHKAAARSWDAKAERWRDVGRGVDGVLSNVVKTLGTPIKVGTDDNGKTRLLVWHEERDRDVFFADLSVGEKWILALPIAVRSLGKGGVFVLRQEGYEGLDPDNRALLVKLLMEHKVVCYTAEPARGDLTVMEVTDPSKV